MKEEQHRMLLRQVLQLRVRGLEPVKPAFGSFSPLTHNTGEGKWPLTHLPPRGPFQSSKVSVPAGEVRRRGRGTGLSGKGGEARRTGVTGKGSGAKPVAGPRRPHQVALPPGHLRGRPGRLEQGRVPRLAQVMGAWRGSGRALTVLASLAKSWPANLTTSPTRRMGQKGASSGWKRQVFMSAAVRLGSRFPLGRAGVRRGGPGLRPSNSPEPQGPSTPRQGDPGLVSWTPAISLTSVPASFLQLLSPSLLSQGHACSRVIAPSPLAGASPGST